MPPKPTFTFYLLSMFHHNGLPPPFPLSHAAHASHATLNFGRKRTIVNWKRRRGRDSPYDTLALDKRASSEDVKKAFYEVDEADLVAQFMAKKYHPDTNSDPNAQQKFLKVKEAFEILKNPSRRAEYDRDGEADPSMQPAMDPQVKWYKNPYAPGSANRPEFFDDAEDRPTPVEAEKRARKKKIALQFGRVLLLYAIALQFKPGAEEGVQQMQPQNNGQQLLWRVRKEVRWQEPNCKESVRLYNEARMPKRAFVVRDPSLPVVEDD